MRPDFERAKDYIFQRLGNELSPDLTYHSLEHTRDDVLPAVIRLGMKSEVDEETLLLLATAALYHDAGFLYHYHGHEEESIAIARATLPDFGYRPEQIQRIAGMISATRMPQHPKDPFEELICDADLDVLGREDFWPRNRDLLAETRLFIDPSLTEEVWLRGQTRFLEDHTYFSPAARFLRDEGQLLNLTRMRAALLSLNGQNDAAHNRDVT
jgi:uncharacterized protein